MFFRFKSCRHLKRREILYMQLSKKTLPNGAGVALTCIIVGKA